MNSPFNHDKAPFGNSHGPMLTGVFAPVLSEECLADLPVEGKNSQLILMASTCEMDRIRALNQKGHTIHLMAMG